MKEESKDLLEGFTIVGVKECIWVSCDIIYFDDLEQFVKACNESIAIFVDERSELHQRQDGLVLIYKMIYE
jgi:hypothetical protein